MKNMLIILFALGGLFLVPPGASAHCDAIDGPVATAALKALDTKNVKLIVPFAPAEAEAEMTATFEQALVVHAKGPEAKALADRYFMETAVRLHRAGEKAPNAGLKPARMDLGPAIPTAERALASGILAPLLKLMTEEGARGITEPFEHTVTVKAPTQEPEARAGVPAARERVSAELAFIGDVENVYRATRGGGHAE
jgi:hypothetical protein